MSKLTSVADDRLAKKRQAAEAAKKHINEAGKPTENALEDCKRLSVDVPVSLHKQLKQTALNQGVTVRELVVSALQEAYQKN